MGLNPLKRLELLIRIHHVSHGTLRLIAHKEYFLHLVVFSGEKTTCFERKIRVHMTNHFVHLSLIESQLGNHLNGGKLPNPSIALWQLQAPVQHGAQADLRQGWQRDSSNRTADRQASSRIAWARAASSVTRKQSGCRQIQYPPPRHI